MREYVNVTGTQTKVDGVEFNKDTVYIRTNIRKEKRIDEITKEEVEFWVYDEKQYDYEEYVAILDSKNTRLEKEVDLTKQAIDELMMMTMEGGMI